MSMRRASPQRSCCNMAYAWALGNRLFVPALDFMSGRYRYWDLGKSGATTLTFQRTSFFRVPYRKS